MIPESLLRLFMSFYPLENDVLEELSLCIEKKEIKKRQLLLKPGQICKHVYFLEKGLIRSYYEENGAEITKWFVIENDLAISVESFYKQIATNEYVEAIEDCVLYYISFERMSYLYEKYHSFSIVVLLLTQHYCMESEERLFNLRKKDAHSRYTYLLAKHPEISLRCPLKYIASYLGITLETISRVRAKI